jgi:hypothetical protein
VIAIVLARQVLAGEADLLDQLGVELRLDRADRYVLAVGGLERVVVVRARVDQVRRALLAPQAGLAHAVDHRHQDRGAVDHRGVHHLAPAGRRALDERARDAEREQHAAAAEVADEIQRRRRLRAAAADRRERARERDVVDVVAGRVRDRALLSPARHAAVDEARVARETDVGAEAEALHHAGPEPLDQRVGALDHPERGGDRLGALQIERHAAAAALHDVPMRLARRGAGHRGGAVDPQHLGAHVGEHHRGERPRADARELEDADSSQRSHVGLPSQDAPAYRSDRDGP